MDELLQNLTVCRCTRPQMRRVAALPGGLLLFALLLCGIGAALMEISPDAGFGMLFAGAVFLICLPFLVKDSIRQYRLLERRFRRYSAEDFLRMEEELHRAPCLFDTLYALQDCLFAPKEGFLIEYEEILLLCAEVHKANLITQGVSLVFVCPGAKLRVQVRDWRGYLNAPEQLKQAVDTGRPPAHPVQFSQKTVHSVHLPHIG